MRLNQMSTLEKQYLVQVSRTVLDPKTDAATLNLDQVAKGAADSLRLDAPKARKLQQRLLADWSNPTEAARRFDGEVKTQLACEQYGVFEPDLLARIAGLTSHVKAAPAGRPEGGELPACFTAEGWNDTFVRLTNDFEGLEPGVTDAREYLNPGGKAMVERLVELAGITPGRQPPLRVLNLCSGEGGEARHLAKLGCEVDAVDISDVACAVAERLNMGNTGPGKVNVICSDIAKIPLEENKYDIIFFPDGDGVHYQQDRQALFDRLQHVTKDGGKLVGSFYVPGQGASQAQRDAFDEGMTWGGFTPRGVNADSYSAGLQQAGFVPTQRDGEAARDSIARREVGGTDIAQVYNDWHEGVLKNQAAEGREDQWLQNNWMVASKQAPNGFGFVLDATVKKSG